MQPKHRVKTRAYFASTLRLISFMRFPFTPKNRFDKQLGTVKSPQLSLDFFRCRRRIRSATTKRKTTLTPRQGTIDTRLQSTHRPVKYNFDFVDDWHRFLSYRLRTRTTYGSV